MKPTPKLVLHERAHQPKELGHTQLLLILVHENCPFYQHITSLIPCGYINYFHTD